ncbi:MAG: hypothetical protein ACJA1T_000482 [Zhongshania aliphaticivorans]|jgi:hypothetical protein
MLCFNSRWLSDSTKSDRNLSGLTFTKIRVYMGSIGGKRNYGYGKQLAWAGNNALADRYGHGHYATKATHEERWNQFAQYLKTQGINDARKIDQTVLDQYGQYVRTLVNSEDIKVAYAQNLLSTVNVVLQTMRKDNVLSIKPAQWVGHRTNVRTTIPSSLEQSTLKQPIDQLTKTGETNVAVIAQLTCAFGLRFKEASLLNAKQALKQANQLGRINITQGTKGGRGKGTDRWVPITTTAQITLLTQAAQIQDKAKSLVPTNKSYNQWRDHAYYQWRTVNKATIINGFHDMRAAYACERYHAITGFPAPVLNGIRQANKTLDTQARVILSQELGHNRIDVIAAYIGSSK